MKKKQEFHNPLEALLAIIAAFTAKHKKSVIFWTVFGSILTVVVVSAAIFFDLHNRAMYASYESIMDEYHTGMQSESPKVKELAAKAAADVEQLREKALRGYIHEQADYILAGLYFKAENFEKAGELYHRYYNEKQKSEFRPLAMVQAALCAEEMKDYDLAYDTYALADSEYGSTELHAELVYNMGRVMLLKKDAEKAKELFSQVIKEAPGTQIAELAKQRLAGI